MGHLLWLDEVSVKGLLNTSPLSPQNSLSLTSDQNACKYHLIKLVFLDILTS